MSTEMLGRVDWQSKTLKFGRIVAALSSGSRSVRRESSLSHTDDAGPPILQSSVIVVTSLYGLISQRI